MFSLEILLLGVALAIDAGVVSFAFGLLNQELGSHHKIQRGLLAASAFGFFQFLMLWLGGFVGYFFTFSSFGNYFQLGVISIFLILGVKCIQESFSLEQRNVSWGIGSILILSVATSIDALVSGVSLATLPDAHLAAMEVGVITFIICLGFYVLAQYFKNIPNQWLLRFAGLIFFFLGGQIFWSLRHIFLKGQS